MHSPLWSHARSPCAVLSSTLWRSLFFFYANSPPWQHVNYISNHPGPNQGRRRQPRARGLVAFAAGRSNGTTRKPIKVLFAAGGTGGHVFPAIAVAEEVISQAFSAGVKAEVLFVGGDRIETKVVPEAGFLLHRLAAPALRRPLWHPANLTLPFRLVLSLLRAMALLRKLRPAVVMGTGGYQSVPVCLAAALLRIPVAVLEPNAAPGLANRLLAPLCAAAFVGFPESRALLRARRAVVSGCPVRRAVAAAGEERGKRERGGTRERRRGERTRVLVVGGSLGAAVLTEAAVGAAEIMEWEESGRVGMVVQTGKGRAREAQRLAEEKGVGRVVTTEEFIDDMPGAYAEACLAVCRAGAITCAELLASGLPSVLVPSPNVTDDHQRRNAEAMVAAGASVMLLERNLSPSSLAAVCTTLVADPETLGRMSGAALRAAKPTASATVARELLKLCGVGSAAGSGPWEREVAENLA